ncbi:MAG: hypothetical protein IPM79_12380 [Polyangiaceae bacterium]|nr:hypothetical protein [Polyangiaceae bacterium]
MSKTAPPAVLPFDAGADPIVVMRPSNIARSAFHIGSAALSLLLLRVVPHRGWLIAIAGSLALWAWSMEIGRRFSPALNARLVKVFSPIAHHHERHQTNSSTWYVTALTVLAIFAPMTAAELGVLVLGLADPAAGEIGRRFGRTSPARGSLPSRAAWASSWWGPSRPSCGSPRPAGPRRPPSGWPRSRPAAAPSPAGSTRRFDDNLAIPLVVAATSTLVLGQLAL